MNLTARTPATLLRLALLGLAGWASTVALAQPALQVTPPQTSAFAWEQLKWQAPPSAQLAFSVQGKAKGFSYSAQAQLHWQVADGRYEAAQEVRLPLLGGRRQSSVGSTGAHGLQPEVFLDRTRKEYSVSFDTSAGQIVFSRGGAHPWQAGTQDRLSVFFQLAGMLAAQPDRYPQGTRIVVQAASKSAVKPWIFVVQAPEQLTLPAGRMRALKLQHLDADNAGSASATAGGPATESATESALWLAPQLGYLPVRIRMQESAQDLVDLQLQSLPPL